MFKTHATYVLTGLTTKAIVNLPRIFRKKSGQARSVSGLPNNLFLYITFFLIFAGLPVTDSQNRSLTKNLLLYNFCRPSCLLQRLINYLELLGLYCILLCSLEAVGGVLQFKWNSIKLIVFHTRRMFSLFVFGKLQRNCYLAV